MKRSLLIITILVTISSGLFATEIDGIYQIAVEDGLGRDISYGTGFYVYSESLKKPVILTSFHLLNSVLLNAETIKINSGHLKGLKLSIASYDELNDILVLSSNSLVGEPLSISDACSGPFIVAGFHNGLFTVARTDEMTETKHRHAKRLSVYLTKGFSGAPVLNENAAVCGMVVLSSEQNASSIVVASTALDNVLTTKREDLDVHALRSRMGVEHIVSDQNTLDAIINSKQEGVQAIIRLVSNNDKKDFIIKNSSNLIIETSGEIKRLVLHNTKNILLRDIDVQRLMISGSEDVFLRSSVFDRSDVPILIKDSNNVNISGCIFRDINTGVVSKSSRLDQAQILNDNDFNTIKTPVLFI